MNDSDKPYLSIIIPVFNEQENIPALYKVILQIVGPLVKRYELLFVDDGSTDRTVPIILSLRREDPHVKLLSLSRNFGHQIALTAGLDHAEGDIAVTMDGDFQHPPELIPRMIEAWRQGNNIVYTERIDPPGISFFKKFTSSLFYYCINKISTVPIEPNAADFRLVDRRVLHTLRTIRERHRFLRGLVNWVGFTKAKIPYTAGTRKYGDTKYSMSKMVHFAVDGLVSFSKIPLILAAILGALLSLCSFIYGCIGIYLKFFSEVPDWWASQFVSTLFSNGMIMLFLGIIGVYVASIHDEVKKRPLYILKESSGVSAAPPFPAESATHAQTDLDDTVGKP